MMDWTPPPPLACSLTPIHAPTPLFVENPFWTVGGLAKALNVAYTTARRAVDRLEAAGIVSLVGAAKRNRVYCARAMLEVLEAPHVVNKEVTA